MADGITRSIADIAEAGIRGAKKGVKQEVKKTAQAVGGQVTGQYSTQQTPNTAQKDKEIKELKQKDEAFRQQKKAELDVKKRQLITEHHKDVQEMEKQILAKQKQEEQERLEAQLAEEEEKKKKEAERQAQAQAAPLEIGGQKQPKGSFMGKIKRGFSMMLFKRTTSKESGKGQGIGG